MRNIGVYAAAVLSAAAAWGADSKPAPSGPSADDVAALIRRLGDEDFAKREQAEAELIRLGASVLPSLRQASSAKDIEAAGRARQIIFRIRWNEVLVRFSKISGQAESEIDFETAVFDLARLENPDVDDKPFRRKLDEYAARVDKVRGEARGIRESVFALRHVLEDNEKFTGKPLEAENADFHAPRNSFLPFVIEKKTGLPISLCAVYMMVGRRCKMPVDGIGARGRFLCKYGDSDPAKEVFIDPFGGKAFSRADFTAGGGDEDDLAAVGPKLILRRMLANLTNGYTRAGDSERLAMVEELAKALEGGRKD